jgi:hypothetical protein
LSKERTQSSVSGYVDGDLNYYDWLKTQSAEFQDDAMGPTLGKLIRDGGLSTDEFSRLQLSRRFLPLNLDQMRNKNPLAFNRAGI